MTEFFGGHLGLWWKFFLEMIHHKGAVMSVYLLSKAFGKTGLYSGTRFFTL